MSIDNLNLREIEMGPGTATRLAIFIGDEVVLRTPTSKGTGLGATAPGSVCWVLSPNSKALKRLAGQLARGSRLLRPVESSHDLKRVVDSVKTLSSFLSEEEIAAYLAAEAEAKAAKEKPEPKKAEPKAPVVKLLPEPEDLMGVPFLVNEAEIKAAQDEGILAKDEGIIAKEQPKAEADVDLDTFLAPAEEQLSDEDLNALFEGAEMAFMVTEDTFYLTKEQLLALLGRRS